MFVDIKGRTEDAVGPKWPLMLFFSVLLHVCAMAVVMFVPETIPGRGIKDTVYEVDLVDLPRELGSTAEPMKKKRQDTAAVRPAVPKPTPAPELVPRKEPRIEKIAPTEKKKTEKVLPIAKRTVEKQVKPEKTPEVSPDTLIDKALSKVQKEATDQQKKATAERARTSQKKPAPRDEDLIASAVERVEKELQSGGQGKTGGGGGSPVQGISLSIYEMEVRTLIKKNWSYPVSLSDPEQWRDLEAVVLVKVKQDGTILDVSWQRRSASAIFDQSVLKAVERSNPLPSFPEGFNRRYEEFEITFNLSELEEM